MKNLFFKNPLAFIMTLMVFSFLPKWVDAQPPHSPKPPKPGHECRINSDCGGRNPICLNGYCYNFGVGGFRSSAGELSNNDKTDFSSIKYWLESDGAVSISLYDVTGQLIRTVVDEWMPSGDHQLAWNEKDDNGNTLTPGLYLLTLQAGDFRETKRVVAFN